MSSSYKLNTKKSTKAVDKKKKIKNRRYMILIYIYRISMNIYVLDVIYFEKFFSNVTFQFKLVSNTGNIQMFS